MDGWTVGDVLPFPPRGPQPRLAWRVPVAVVQAAMGPGAMVAECGPLCLTVTPERWMVLGAGGEIESGQARSTTAATCHECECVAASVLEDALAQLEGVGP